MTTDRLIDKHSDQFLLDSYAGEGGYCMGYYLVRHSRESDDKYQRRKTLAVYPNFVRKIANVFMGFLWKRKPNREVDELYAQFASNADGAGGKLDNVLADYQRLAMILGTVFIIVDKPIEQGVSRATQALPYIALRLKDQLIRETKDAAGVWESVTLSETLGTVTRYRAFTRTTWQLSSDSEGNEIISSGSHNLGRVPVVRLHIAKPLKPTDTCSQPWLRDIAVLNWDLYNRRSELIELFRAQTFAILAMPVIDKEEAERLTDMTIGTENAITYNPTGGGEPKFIAPPPDPVQLYMKQIADTVVDIYRLANLEFVGSVQPSGEALSFHFREADSGLGAMANLCEAAEIEIAQLVYAWQGQTFDGAISYPDDFNLAAVKTELLIAMDSVGLNMGSEYEKAVKKRLAKQILGSDTSPSVLAAIDAEIDAMGDVYGDRLAQQAAP